MNEGAESGHPCCGKHILAKQEGEEGRRKKHPAQRTDGGEEEEEEKQSVL